MARSRKQPAIDVEVENHGSICRVRPITSAARDWIDENVEYEGWQWFGGGLCVEPRLVDMLIGGMMADGLQVA